MKVLAEIDSDDVLTITKSKKQKENLPAYDCIGGNMEYKTKVQGYPDLYSVIQSMSKQTSWLWWELIKKRNRYTNEAKYVAETGFDKRRLTVAYKDLFNLNLVKRVRKQHYLINPLAYLPEYGHFNEILSKWEEME